MTSPQRPRRATFIGIGAQKTASTWLHSILAQLPRVAVSELKEIDFFNAYYDRGYEWYERHFDPDGTAAHRGEVSPNYFVDGDSPARARAYNKELRLFVTLRDPVDRAFSNHLHEVRKGHISGDNLDFDAALNNNPLYLEQGRYAAHLQRWLDHFPRDQVLVLFQETIRLDSAGEGQKAARFLGLADEVALVNRDANESVAYRNKLIGETFWRVGNLARANGLGGALEAVKTMPVVRTLRAANRTPVRDLVAPMSAQTKARLTEFYREDVAALKRLTGEEPPWPRFFERAKGQPEPAPSPARAVDAQVKAGA